MPDTPITEPTQVRAGDSVTWSREIEDYTAGEYTLYYSLRNADGRIDITAGADGGGYLVDLASTQTTGWTAGHYDWIGYVKKGAAERHTVDSGRIEILPNLENAVAYDARSDARTIYDNLITAYKTYIAEGTGHVVAMSIAGKAMSFRNTDDFITQIKYWENKVRAEDEAEAIANNKANPRRVGIRFNRL